MKKPYEKPAIVYAEPLVARTTSCARSDEACRTSGGPISC